MIEGDPYALIEAMTIAAYATDCEHGFVYLRGEYPQAHAILGAAIAEARRRGYLGDDVLGEGFAFDIEIRKGGGRVHLRRGDRDLQLDRGLSRRAPQQAAVPRRRGAVREADRRQQRRDAGQRARRRARERARLRRDGHRGVDRTEALLPVGPRRAAGRLRGAVRDDAARSCSSWPAASPAGARCRPCCWAAPPAGSCGPDELDLPLTFEGAREARTTLGSGVVMVLDDTRRPAALPDAHRRLLPQRVVRSVRPVPRRHRAPAGGARPARLGPHARRRRSASWR